MTTPTTARLYYCWIVGHDEHSKRYAMSPEHAARAFASALSIDLWNPIADSTRAHVRVSVFCPERDYTPHMFEMEADVRPRITAVDPVDVGSVHLQYDRECRRARLLVLELEEQDARV